MSEPKLGKLMVCGRDSSTGVTNVAFGSTSGTAYEGDRGFDLEEILQTKATKATTLSGYGIENAYTKAEVDAAHASMQEEVDALKNVATTSKAGLVKPDNTSIVVDTNGTLSATYSLPTASETKLGGVKVDNDTIKINSNGVISCHKPTWANIEGKPTSYVPSAHNHDSEYYTKNQIDLKMQGKSDTGHVHVTSDITDFPTELPASDVYGWAKASTKPEYDYSELKNVPKQFTPADHTHDNRYFTESETTTLLAGKAEAIHTHTKSDITDFPASMPASDVYSWAKAPAKPTYSYTELKNVPSTFAPSEHKQAYTSTECTDYSSDSNTLGTTPAAVKKAFTLFEPKSHKHTKADITDFPTSMPASDVSAWAKAPAKPTYTYTEVGAAASSHTHDDRYYTESEIDTKLSSKVNTSLLGAANGVATLGGDGKVPAAQLPSFVDDVLEYDALAKFPAEGETGKIYVAKDTNKTYRWSGTAYVVISETLAIGTTATTACAGNDARLSNARPASDVYAWAKASTKPSYAWSEITSKPSTFTPADHTHGVSDISNAVTTNSAQTISGNKTFTGTVLLGTANYGTSLPSSGTTGQIFFKIVG